MLTEEDVKHYTQSELKDFETKPRVEIFIFSHSTADITSTAADSIIKNTEWPYKLSVVDTSMYPAVMAKIYNKFLLSSECEFVAIVCSDSVVPKNWIQEMMGDLISNEKMVAIGPITDTHMNEKMRALRENTGNHKVRGVWASLPIIIWKKSILKELGGYDERFFLHGHDPDSMRRAEEKGYYICVNTNVLAKHTVGETTRRLFSMPELMTIKKYNDHILPKS